VCGGELVQKEAVRLRNAELLRGLAKEFVEIIKSARNPAGEYGQTAQVR